MPQMPQTQASTATSAIAAVNETARFNMWCGFTVAKAGGGEAEISMPWRPEVAQYAGFLHAGVVAALIDTACGFAAASVVGPVLAAHFSVNCLRPAKGETFVARARVIKAGRSQVFTSAELFAVVSGRETLVATGETLLSVAGERADAASAS